MEKERNTLVEICAGENTVSTIAGKKIFFEDLKEEEMYAITIPSGTISLPQRIYPTLKALIHYQLIHIGNEVILSIPNEKPVKGRITFVEQKPRIQYQNGLSRSFGEFFREVKKNLKSPYPYRHLSVGAKHWDQIQQNFQSLLNQHLSLVIFASGLAIITARLAATLGIFNKRLEETRKLRLSDQPLIEEITQSLGENEQKLKGLEDKLKNEVDELILIPETQGALGNKEEQAIIANSPSTLPTNSRYWWYKGIPLTKEIAKYYEDSTEELTSEEIEEMEKHPTRKVIVRDFINK